MEERGFRVLVVDDEPEIRRFLRASLKNHQYDVHEAETGRGAITAVREVQPDLVILDLGLPDMDGTDVIQRVRYWNQVPIIILSVRNRETDKIDALNAGADDYLTKPFGVGELLARIRVVMKRVGKLGTQPVYQVGDLVVDLDRHLASVAGKEVDLTPTEFDLLSILIQHAGKVLTQRQLMEKVWGQSYENDSRLLRVNISNLRRKIETKPNQYIITELGIGYRLVEG